MAKIIKEGMAAMTDFTKFYINGEWVAPAEPRPFDVINPANEEAVSYTHLTLPTN